MFVFSTKRNVLKIEWRFRMDFFLNWFTQDETFPFFIQYGTHDEDLCLHTHADFSELVIVLSGTATHVVDGEEYPIRKGDVFVISNNTAHGYKHPKNFHICNIMFHLSYFLDYQSDIKTTAGFHALFVIEPTLTKTQGFKRQLTLNLAQYEEIHRLIVSLKNEYETKLPGYQTMIISLLSQLFTSLSRFYDVSQKSDSKEVVSIANTIAYIENHYNEDLSIEELAQYSGLSSRHFRRIFQRIYSISPTKYMTILRIQAAMKALQNPHLSITEIALLCGFSDSNYFSRKFKAETGKSPLEYRKYIQGLSNSSITI